MLLDEDDEARADLVLLQVRGLNDGPQLLSSIARKDGEDSL